MSLLELLLHHSEHTSRLSVTLKIVPLTLSKPRDQCKHNVSVNPTDQASVIQVYQYLSQITHTPHKDATTILIQNL
jgi:hypothetical protein